MNKRKVEFKFELSSWTVLKGKVTHFCIQQSHVMRCGYFILHLRPKGPVWNGMAIQRFTKKAKTILSAANK
jgi:hypothetical protein